MPRTIFSGVTVFLELGPSREVESYSDTQEFLSILLIPKVQYCV
jgi:hypothetical protein